MSLESEAAAAATAAEAPVGDREGGDSGNEPPAEELGGVAGAVVDVAWDVVRSIWTPGVNRGLLQCVALLFVMLLLNSKLARPCLHGRGLCNARDRIESWISSDPLQHSEAVAVKPTKDPWKEANGHEREREKESARLVLVSTSPRLCTGSDFAFSILFPKTV